MTRSRMILLGSIGLSLSLTASACNKALFPVRVGDRAAGADRDRPDNAQNVARHRADRQDRFADAYPRLATESQAKPGGPLHAYTNQRIIMIRRPKRYGEEELSRVAVWWTDNNGFYWQKAGYFGRKNSSFPFQVEEDGDYGIRFVGPADEPAQQVLAYPERIYHVDSMRPAVEVAVDPAREEYHVGDLVAIDWLVRDTHPAKYPVRIAAIIEAPDSDVRTIEVQRDLAEEGTIGYRIPPEAVERDITFRIEARDRSGNVGLAYSHAFSVSPEPPREDDPADVAITDASAADNDQNIATMEQTPMLVIGPLLVPSQAVEQEEPAGRTDQTDESDVELPVEPLAMQALDVDVQRVVDAAAREPAAPDADPLDPEAQTVMVQAPAGEELRANAVALAMRLKNEVVTVASQMITAFEGWRRSASLALAENKLLPTEQTASDLGAAALAVGSDTTDDRKVAGPPPFPEVGDSAGAPPFPGVGDGSPDRSIIAATHSAMRLKSEVFSVGSRMITAFEGWWRSAALELAENKPLPTEQTASDLGAAALAVGPDTADHRMFADVAEPPNNAEALDSVQSGDAAQVFAIGEQAPYETTAGEPIFDQPPVDAAVVEQDVVTAAEPSETADLTDGIDAARTLEFGPRIVLAEESSEDGGALEPEPCEEEKPLFDSDGPLADAGNENADALPEATQEATLSESQSPSLPPQADASREVATDTTAPFTNTTRRSPGEVPFASAIARLPSPTARLTWDGPTHVAAPSGQLAEQEPAPAAVDGQEDGDESEPILPVWPGGEVTAVDPTRGNGLLVPLPATVEDQAPMTNATAHPWRVLGNATAQRNQAVWTLPQPQPNVDWQPPIPSRFLADNPAMRDVAESGDTARALAGTTEDLVDGEPVQP